ARWLERQLRPPQGDDMPAEAKALVAAMTITQRPMRELATEQAGKRREFRRMSDPAKAKEAQQALQQELNRLAREAMTRSVLRAVYSPWQLREQMTWFWMNHFSVFAGKAETRVYLADYEEKAIRPNSLGRFRDLLGATARHPAMLRYLDNAQNRAGHINENYARELDEALDRLARHPSTARFVSRKLAVFFVADEPPAALIERMAGEWARTDGDIAALLRIVFASDEFRSSLNQKFKDPVHYVYSAVRIAYDGRPMPEPGRVLLWLGRLGEPLYLRQTPDGYPLARGDWSSAGQMAARFEVARAIGYAAPALEAGAMRVSLGEPTRAALEKASSAQER